MFSIKKILPLFLIFSFLFFAETFSAQSFSVSKLFSDHMVLQRNQPIKVWGWAGQDAKVSADFNGQEYSTKTEKSGKWILELPAMKAGGPYNLKLSAADTAIKIVDILIGDVWLCSGQSNMEWLVANSNNAEMETANTGDAKIRHFKIPRTYAEKPAQKIAGGKWEVASPETVGSFSAVAYYFAKQIRMHHDVPIGLLNNAWGGSRIEAWMSAGTLNFDDMENIIETVKQKSYEAYLKRVEKIKEKDPNISNRPRGIINGNAIWAGVKYDDNDWQKINVPNLWEQEGYNGFDGFAWYRFDFELSEEEIKDPIKLSIGKIDDSDITYLNGQQIGSMDQQYNKVRNYKAPVNILKTGKNTIAIRVEDTGGGGGVYGEEELFFIQTNKRKIPIAGKWKIKLDAFLEPTNTFNAHHTPTLLYNKLIYPIKDFSLAGSLWYQGESNANPGEADEYRNLFSDMIDLWRSDFKSPDLPFLYVQLANFMQPADIPKESDWATLRESQTHILNKKNTAQAVIIDIGEANDIHPRNKQDVGLRLALAARKMVYGENIVYSSPMYKSHEIINNKFIISFDHTGDGLMVKNKYGYINGFAMAGADKKFHWAKAAIENNKVVVWCDKIEEPKFLRYAWGDNPDDVNLVNSVGLPAGPFRVGE